MVPMDGILGLGFSSISDTNSENFVQNAYSEGHITAPEFSFALRDTDSELFIGGANPAKYTGPFTCTPVIEKGYWLVQGSAQPSTSNPPAGQYSGKMIIDSGTTLLMGDKENVAKFYAGLEGAATCADCGDGFYSMPCNSIPDVVVGFNGGDFTIPAAAFNGGCFRLVEDEFVLIATKSSGASLLRQLKLRHCSRLW
jgi:cathepsin D